MQALQTMTTVQTRSIQSYKSGGFPLMPLRSSRPRPTIQRRHSETSISSTSTSRKPLQRLSCVQSQTNIANWAELTTRQTLLKFRTRAAATRSSKRRLSGDKPRHPSYMLRDALDYQHQLCMDLNSSATERTLAVCLSRFLGKMIDLYYIMTEEGRDRSFFKWTLAVLAVMFMTIILLGVLTFAADVLLTYVFLLFHAALPFCFMLLTLCVIYLSCLTIVNFK